jgi:hydrogenase expression/formation protein HypC
LITGYLNIIFNSQILTFSNSLILKFQISTMCLSVPAKILSVEGNTAKASVGGAIVDTSLHLVDDVQPGDYVLIHTGFALQKISEEEALETIRLIREIESLEPEQ